MVALFLVNRPAAAYSIAGFGMVPAQIAATASASLFAFFCVAALQGLLICLTTTRGLSPHYAVWIQMLGMSAMQILSSARSVRSMRDCCKIRRKRRRQPWLWLHPTDLVFRSLRSASAGNSDPRFSRRLATAFGLGALGIFAAALFVLTWTIGFRRHLPAQPRIRKARPHQRSRAGACEIPGAPPCLQQQAIFAFTGRTLARSTKHRLFLATWLSVGSFAGAAGSQMAVRDGR